MVRVPLTPDELLRGRELGAMLRLARGDRTLLDVAGRAGISPETLRKIETGRIPTPSFSTVALLAVEVGLSMDAIWHELGATRAAGPPAQRVRSITYRTSEDSASLAGESGNSASSAAAASA